MRHQSRLVVAAAAAALLSTSPGASAQTTEQAVFVSVSDQSGAPVNGLGADAFAVREDGRAREVLRASRAVQPIDLALLVDNSQAATRHINDLRLAVAAFVRRMTAGQHQVALVAIADRPTVLQDYTASGPALIRASERIFAQPASGTTLLDALVEVSRGMQKRDSERRVIVAITTEGTDFSNPNHRHALDALKASGAAFWALVLTEPGGGDITTEEARSRGIVLSDGTSASGGRLEHLLSSMALRESLDRLAADLEAQYHVVYGRPGALIPPKAVDVSVTRPGTTVRFTPAAVPARPSQGD